MPVLWQPLHQAPSGRFWWGSGGPEAFKSLWRLLFERLTGRHGLHNLIWVLSNGPDALAWYPGDDVVDIVGYDQYESQEENAAVASWAWNRLLAETAGTKMLAMTANGSIPNVDLMERLGVRWLWFCTAEGAAVQDDRNPAEGLRRAYLHSSVLTYDELPGAGWLPPS